MQRPIKSWKNNCHDIDLEVYAEKYIGYSVFQFKDGYFELNESQTKELIKHLQDIVKYKELEKGET